MVKVIACSKCGRLYQAFNDRDKCPNGHSQQVGDTLAKHAPGDGLRLGTLVVPPTRPQGGQNPPTEQNPILDQMFQLLLLNLALQTLNGLNPLVHNFSLPELPPNRPWQEELPFLTDSEMLRREAQRRLEGIELDAQLETERLDRKKRDLESENRRLTYEIDQKRRQL